MYNNNTSHHKKYKVICVYCFFRSQAQLSDECPIFKTVFKQL